MSDDKLIKWSGVVAALAGIAMLAYMVIHPWGQRTGDIATTAQWFASHAFHLAGALLLGLGLFGLYMRQRRETGIPGLLSFLLAYLGTALFIGTGVTSAFLWPSVAEFAPSFVAADGQMFSHWKAVGPILAARVFLVLGFVWFGFVSFRAGVLPRGASLLVMLGVVAMNLPTPPVGPVPWLVTVIGAGVFCLGLLGWGRALWTGAAEAHDTGIAFLATRKIIVGMGVAAVLVAAAASVSYRTTISACADVVRSGLLEVATDRSRRFLGKVQEQTARCRGGEAALEARSRPWVDWTSYYATRDGTSRSSTWLDPILTSHIERNGRGIDGALMDLEYQRVELIQFNLFDNSGTYPAYVRGRGDLGPSLRWWPEMQLPAGHPDYQAVGGPIEQICRGDLIRARTLRGICNDLYNPAMGSTGTLFARNVEFESTYPTLGHDSMSVNRHGDRLGLLQPDPQLISRMLFTRHQTNPAACNAGTGVPADPSSSACDYQQAPFFNVLAAFWIQFMTHDWFTHLVEGENEPASWATVGCVDARAVERGCRPADRMDQARIAEDGAPPTFQVGADARYARAYKTTTNNVTAWWDASQIYGYDDTSVRRVKRDPSDAAKLLLQDGYLPVLAPDDPQLDQWRGQEAVAFPDNFNIGLSFYHNVFAREHNAFVDAFREMQRTTPDASSGLVRPDAPTQPVAYRDVTDEELYQVARLVVAAEIAKVHTIEWTTQLLYDEPLYRAMNANWNGLFDPDSRLSEISERIRQELAASADPNKRNLLLSLFASGSGIVGSGSRLDDPTWSITSLADVNGGVSHFGSPFNFPEEFVTVYRLHPLVPDLIEFRDLEDPNQIQTNVPVVETAFAGATSAMHRGGLPGWAVSMGRQRLGLLALGNHPQFLQNLRVPRLESETQQIDVPALDVLRDRERGIPRFNEFRRQYGLKAFRTFEELAGPIWADSLRAIYGTHTCDASKVITRSQVYPDGPNAGSLMDDCLGFPDGTEVDNVEDVDAVVGWLAEEPALRPHGFAISETQFHVFIINASRRLFSDRFFTSSFRPEFYSSLGHAWVMNNGPGDKQYEPGEVNGHEQEVSPMKRILLRVMPELTTELEGVVNVFDPWARDRGEYYCLDWKPRPGAEGDPAFAGWQDAPLSCSDTP